jgi:hypothetical protein
MFLINVGFLTQQILGIVGFQIEINKIFSFICIRINLKRYHLQLDNLKNLILVNKNWPNDARVGCNNLFNLVEFMKIEVDLEEGLGDFER